MQKYIFVFFTIFALFSTIVCTSANQSVPNTTFTIKELAQYDGLNGSKAYIAVDGIIYDVTSVFKKGAHQGLQLDGTDATVAFESRPHSSSILNGLPKVVR
jgi:predicted heme/steroid binding protein